MKKFQFTVWFLCFILVLGTGGQKVSAEARGDVAINAQNFPDEKFRKLVMESMFNKNYDQILTGEEIKNATILEISTEDTTQPGNWDVTGVEKLKDLTSVVLKMQGVQQGKNIVGREVRGTFQNNKKLTSFVLDMDGRKITQDEIERLIPIAQIKELCIENADIQKLSLSKAAKLRTLTVKKCKNLKTLNISKNQKLEKITVENTSLRKIDLTNNEKLKELSVQFGSACVLTDLVTGKTGKIPFFKWSDHACKIQFPKKNRIVKINYFTTDKKLDITRCKKVKEIHVSRRTKIKAEGAWYKKNRKNLVVYAQGFRQKKLKVRKDKNNVLLQAVKVRDTNKGYYCEELDREGDS